MTIPDNATATLFIPARAESDILENNKPISSYEEIQMLGIENNIAELRVGSGTYNFKMIPLPNKQPHITTALNTQLNH